jgi:hypothetical protein
LGLFLKVFSSFLLHICIHCNTLYHHHQILPTGLKRIGVLIKNRQFESAGFQLHVIDYQTSKFHMQDFHAGTRAVDKDVHITILNITTHQIGHHTAEGIKTPAHICGEGIQIVPHGGREAEHPTDAVKATVSATSPDPANSRVSYSRRWGNISHRKRCCLQLPELKKTETQTVPEMTLFAAGSQKQLAQILSWVATVFLTCSANNKTWPHLFAGWHRNLG